MMQFDFSNWNYSFAKNTDPDRYADNCADMGLTIAMLPRTDYDSEAEGLRIMDALHDRDIRVIVKDGRTSWANEKDPGIYREDILATKRAFNEHPAFWCHCVRDEPYPKDFAPKMIARLSLIIIRFIRCSKRHSARGRITSDILPSTPYGTDSRLSHTTDIRTCMTRRS